MSKFKNLVRKVRPASAGPDDLVFFLISISYIFSRELSLSFNYSVNIFVFNSFIVCELFHCPVFEGRGGKFDTNLLCLLPYPASKILRYAIFANICLANLVTYLHTLLEKFWLISLYLTDDAIAKLYVTKSFAK